MSHGERIRCRAHAMAALVLLAGATLVAPAARGQDSADAAPPTAASEVSVDEVVRRLSERYPDLVAAGLDSDQLVATVLSVAESTAVESDGKRLNLLLVAAELYESIGEPAKARSLWANVGRNSTDATDKVRALFALGLHYLLRERYEDVLRYWKWLPEAAPDSSFAALAARYRPLLEITAPLGARDAALEKQRKGEAVEIPEFPAAPAAAGVFGELGERALESFRGRWVLLDFWSSDSYGARAAALALRETVDAARARGWDGVVLGVNLDASRERFERALAEWTVESLTPEAAGDGERDEQRPALEPAVTWPQHHDGKGFDSPVARALGVPRAPFRVLIDPEGRVTFVTRSGASLWAALRGAAVDDEDAGPASDSEDER